MRRPKPTPASRPLPAAGPVSQTPKPASSRWQRRIVIAIALLALAGGAWWLWGSDRYGDVRAALERRDFLEADVLLDKRLKDDPDDGEARLLAVQSARRNGDIARAADYLRLYTKSHGTNTESMREARCLFAFGDRTEAEKLLTDYRKNPQSPGAYLLLEAHIEGKLRAIAPRGGVQSTVDEVLEVVTANEPDVHRALDEWQAARPGRADQTKARLWRARLYLAANKYAEAVAALREALELTPDSLEARFQLALALQITSPDESRALLESLHATAPANAYFSLGLANTYRMLGRGADARRLYEGLLGDRLGTDAQLELGTLDLDEGKYEDAGKRLQNALQAAPDSPRTNRAMYRYHQLTGQSTEAAKYRARFEELEAGRKPSAPK